MWDAENRKFRLMLRVTRWSDRQVLKCHKPSPWAGFRDAKRLLYMYSYRVARRPNSPEQIAFGAAVGERVRMERARLTLSSDQLARASNVSVDLIRSLENGRVASPGLFSIAAVAAALGVAIDDLVPEVRR